ncbi:hypothetical protein AB0C59_28130 [Streptomyces sp. NPDC048664]|uniref:hypothetical protein n=1 Tax=Streptomyces sp. NPDC048664 TaxID=3154505 RepID=UPI0034474317
MSAHPAHSSEKPVVIRPPETGWARSRSAGEDSLRTCVAAVETRTAAPGARRGPESNIVRGED